MSNDTPLEVKLISQGAQQAAPVAVPDEFRGDNAALVGSIQALLSLDEKGALAPHGIGHHARTLLASAAARITAPPAQQRQSAWTRDTPTEQARYWYWDGHEDSAPINVGVFGSPSGCFVHVGHAWN